VVITANANFMGPENISLLVVYAMNYPFQTFNSVFVIFFTVFKSCHPFLFTLSLLMVCVSRIVYVLFPNSLWHGNIKQIWSYTFLPGKKKSFS